jgi:signal transduction histidine kinase
LLVLQATLVATLVFLVPLLLTVRQLASDHAVSDARVQAAAIVPVLAANTDPLTTAEAAARTGCAGRLTLYPPGGDPVGSPRAKPETVSDVADSRRSATHDVPGGVVYLQPVQVRADGVAVVEVFVPEADLHYGVRSAWLVLIAAAVGLVLVSVVVADRLCSRTVRAVNGLTAATRRFGQADLAVRIEPAGPPELREIGRSFNAMADQMVSLLHAEHQRAADLSHRLRTHLTALQLKLETPDESLRNDGIRRAVSTLSDEVDEIIRAAQETPFEHAAGRSDLTAILGERLAFWSVLAEDDNRPWAAVGGTAPLWVPVPQAEAAAAVDALLGNVFHHTPEGTAFRAGVIGATLVVEDDGPGIDDSDAASQRGTSSRGSTGLGLDIVRRMAASAGGTLVITRGARGGARIEMRLPPNPDDS